MKTKLGRWWVLVVWVCLAVAPTGASALGPSQTVELKVLEWLTKQTAFGTAPAQLWFSLHGTDPGDTCANELASSGAYARAQLNPDPNNATDTNYNAVNQVPAASAATNKLDVTFPQASADWFAAAAIPYFCMRDASTAGVCLWCGQIAGGTGVVVLSGTTLKFTGGSPGQMSATLD